MVFYFNLSACRLYFRDLKTFSFLPNTDYFILVVLKVMPEKSNKTLSKSGYIMFQKMTCI